MQIAIHIDIPISRYRYIPIGSDMDICISTYPYIYRYPDNCTCRYTAIQIYSYSDSCIYGYMSDLNVVYQSVIPEPICEKHPQNPLFCPLWYSPCFLFCSVQVVFLYVQRSYHGRTHKNQLAPKQPGSGGEGLLRGRKKVATPFFSCKAHHIVAVRRNIHKPLKPSPC